jgi:capsular polysaccharide biosynthesis protein/Tfp pilus assembly protein PilF
MSATAAQTGRNAPCPCGSGRKAKRCHAGFASAPPRSAELAAVRAATARAERIAALHATAADDFAAARWIAVVAGATEILRLDPANAPALGLMGLVAHHGRQLDTAVEYLFAAVAAAPANPHIRRSLAAVLADAGLVDEAIAQLELAVAAASDPAVTVGPDARLVADVAADLAGLHLRAGRPEAARRFGESALSIDPDQPAALATVVTLDMAAGRLADARAGYERIATLSDRPSLDEHLIAASPVTSVRAWTLASGDAYTVVEPAGPLEIARPRYAGDPVAPPPLRVVRPETYVAELRDATVIGGESLVLARDGTVLFDMAVHPDADRFDLVRGALRYLDRRAALVHAAAGDGRRIERGILLSGPATHNYYHWLLESLTQLRVLDAVDELAGWPLLVDRAMTAVPQLGEALDRLVGPGRERIVLDPREAVRVERVALASPGAWLPLDLKNGLMLEPGDAIVDPAAIEYLRRRLMPADLARSDAATPGRRGTQRIHLARSRVGRLQNAAELRPVLARFGFVDVLPETMSFDAQVRLAADADVIVAETGAALTNLIFAPRTARIVVLGADRWDLTLFSQLAGALGQELIYVAGSPIRGSHPKVYQSKFTLAPAALRDALADLLGTAA